jgi:hypothetical protein
LTRTAGTPVAIPIGTGVETTATVECSAGEEAFGGGGEVTGIPGSPAVIVDSVPVSATEWSVTTDNVAGVGTGGHLVAVAQCG